MPARSEAGAAERPGEPLVLLDGHVHIYPCFDRERLLDAAAANFRAAAARLGSSEFDGVLMLTESRGHAVFDELVAAPRVGRWEMRPADDGVSLAARKASERLILVAGRQIETAERIEVSALALREPLPDGRPLEDTLEAAGAAGATVVLPWGVGKWLGHRGRMVRQALARPRAFRLFVGDIGGRPRRLGLPGPAQFADGRTDRIVRGTDPLPLASEAARPGGFGNAYVARLDQAGPARCAQRLLHEAAARPFGEAETWVRFIFNQLRMRLR
jgi:hypothetical protein